MVYSHFKNDMHNLLVLQNCIKFVSNCKKLKMSKGIFITMVILDVMAVIGSIVGVVASYAEPGRFDPLPWCLLLSWGIIGIIKDGLIYRGSEMSSTGMNGVNQINDTLRPQA